MEESSQYHVAIIGAGPAGLFAARELAEHGVNVSLFNRDIKPGGLAEYGIYPTKLRMKEGLRNQFRQILAHNNIHYYGNVQIGENADLSLDDLRQMGYQAILVSVGAQSTKRLGLPGEDLKGVYHAKDIVYHYNLLPPFSENTYQIGKRVAVIGVGNVMVDVTHWLIEEKHVDEVVAIARRGPMEVKFDRKELEEVVSYLDMSALDAELERVAPIMRSLGQLPSQFRMMIRQVALKAPNRTLNTRFWLRFLSSPVQIVGNERGEVSGFKVEENNLEVTEDGGTQARGLGIYHTLDVDTVIFAIGDQVDSAIGLPVQSGEFVKNPFPRYPMDGVSYEAYDPQTEQPIPDVFLAGWARKPSTGLVGVARKDGITAARALAQYLEGLAPASQPVCEETLRRLTLLDKPIITKQELGRLETLERERAQGMQLNGYKFATNRQMLEALELVK